MMAAAAAAAATASTDRCVFFWLLRMVLIGCVRERERRRIIGADENHQNPITRLRI